MQKEIREAGVGYVPSHVGQFIQVSPSKVESDEACIAVRSVDTSHTATERMITCVRTCRCKDVPDWLLHCGPPHSGLVPHFYSGL
jgi:hypothetical protein